jgi:hypothetical protein
VWLQVKCVKGFRHVGLRTVSRRVEALKQQGWIAQAGSRYTQPGWPSELYELALRGSAVLMLDGKNIEEFLKMATEEKLLKFIYSLS